jgi:3-dehydroquinate dehydratase-1
MEFEEFVLAASTADLAAEPAAREHADAVAFRLDLAADGVSSLSAYDGELPLVATNRVAWEGGGAADEPARLDALAAAVEHPAVEAVDVELAAVRAGDCSELIEHARAHAAAVIVSVHDFEETPDQETMEALLTEAAAVGDVGKLAVTAETRRDVLALLTATQAVTASGRLVATMAMGAVGRHSRAVAPLYGSRIGYAPVDPADATAPGQYELATLRRLVTELGER